MKKGMILFASITILLLAQSMQLFSITSVNSFTLKHRFDHDGGKSGNYFGDKALVGYQLYAAPAGFCENEDVGDIGTFLMVDSSWNKVIYNTKIVTTKKIFGLIPVPVIKYTAASFFSTFNSPWGLVGTSDGRYNFISDTGNHRIVVVRNNKQSLSLVNVFGSFGNGEGQFRRPRNLYLDSSYLYISDYGNNRVSKYNYNGSQADLTAGTRYLTTTPDGQNISNPTGISIYNTQLSLAEENGRIHLYAATGAPVKTVNAAQLMGLSKIFITDIAHDFYGTLYVLDKWNSYVHIFSPDLKYIASVGGNGYGNYVFDDPRMLCLDRRSGIITVTDRYGFKRFSIMTKIAEAGVDASVFAPAADSNNSVKMSYSVTTGSFVTLKVKNSSGEVVRSLFADSYRAAGKYEIVWNGKNDQGEIVENGTYRFEISAELKYAARNTDIRNVPVTVSSAPLLSNLMADPVNWVFPGQPLAVSFDADQSCQVERSIVKKTNTDTYQTLQDLGQMDVNSGRNDFNVVHPGYEDNRYFIKLLAKNSYGFQKAYYVPFYLNQAPLAISDFSLTGKVSAVVSDYSICKVQFTFNEDAQITATVYEGTSGFCDTTKVKSIVLSKEYLKGSHALEWNSRDAFGNAVRDGVYTIVLDAAQLMIGDSTQVTGQVYVDNTAPKIVAKTPGLTDCPYFSPTDSPGIKDTITIECTVTEDAVVKAWFVDNTGNVLTNYAASSVLSGTGKSFVWNGLNPATGKSYPDGEYSLRFTATDNVGNMSSFVKAIVLDNNMAVEGKRFEYVFNQMTHYSGREALIHYSDAANKIVIIETNLVIPQNNDIGINIFIESIGQQRRLLFSDIKRGNWAYTLYPKYQTTVLTPAMDKLIFFNGANYYYNFYDLKKDCISIRRSTGWLYLGPNNRDNIGPGPIMGITKKDVLFHLGGIEEPYCFSYIAEQVTTTNLIPIFGRNIFTFSGSWEQGFANNMVYHQVAKISENASYYAYYTCLQNGQKAFAVYDKLSGLWPAPQNIINANVLDFEFHPNGDDLYFIVQNGVANINIYKYSFPTKELQQICAISNIGTINYSDLFLDRNGDNLFFYTGYNDLQNTILHIYSIQSGLIEAKTLNAVLGKSFNFQWSLDGNTLFFNNNNGGTANLWSMKLKETNPKNLISRLDYPNNSIPYISDLVTIKGTAGDGNFSHYVLEYRATNSTVWETITRSSNQVLQGELGSVDTYDTLKFQNNASYEFRLIAYDLAGNARTNSVVTTVLNNVDYALTSVTVDSLYVNGNVIFSGCYRIHQDSSLVEVSLQHENGSSSTIFSGVRNNSLQPYTHDLKNAIAALPEGRVSFTVKCTFQGNAVTQSADFYIDRTMPSVAITGPVNNSVLSNNLVALNGSMHDQFFDRADIYLSEKSAPSAADWRYIASVDKPVTNGFICSIDTRDCNDIVSIRIVAMDKAGNTATNEIQYRLDKTAPTAMFTAPLGQEIVGSAVRICGTVFDNYPDTFGEYRLYYAAGHGDGQFIEIPINEALRQRALTNGNLLGGDSLWNTGALNGPYTIKLTARDKSGNQHSAVQYIYIDNTPPVTALKSHYTLYTNGNNVFCGAGNLFSLVVDPLDGLSAVRKTMIKIDDAPQYSEYAASFTLRGEGVHTICYYSMDASGNIEAAKSNTIIVDATPPGALVVVNEPKFTANGLTFVPFNNAVSFGVSDPGTISSGVRAVYYSIDGGRSFDVYVPQLATGINIQRPGTNIIQYYALDQVGNTSATNSIPLILDTYTPFTSIKCHGTHFEVGNVIFINAMQRITLEPHEDWAFDSGVKKTEYSINAPDSFVGGTNINLPTQVSNVVLYRSIDNVGNTEQIRSKIIVIDDVPPAVSLVAGGVFFTNGSHIYISKTNYFKFTALDALSQCKAIYYSTNASVFMAYQGQYIRQSRDGQLNIGYYAVDNLDNSSVTNIRQYSVDATPPMTSYSIQGKSIVWNGRLYIESGAKIELKAQDAASGVKEISYQVNNGTSNPYSGLISFTSAGTNYVSFSANDNIGNKSAVTILTMVSPLPDTNPPVTVLEALSAVYTNALGQKFMKEKANIEFLCKDIIGTNDGYASGVASCFHVINGGPSSTNTKAELSEGDYVINYWGIDVAGNQETKKTLDLHVDGTAPVTAHNYWADNIWTNQPAQIVLAAVDPTNRSAASGIRGFFSQITGTATITTTNHRLPIIVENGITRVEYYATDNVGNMSIKKTLTVKIDMVAPVIAFTGFTNGLKYGRQGILPGMSVIEQNVKTNYMEIALSGQPFSYLAPGTRITNEGKYQLRGYAQDLAGNSTVIEGWFVIDTTSPGIPEGVCGLLLEDTILLNWLPVNDSDLIGYKVYMNGILFGQQNVTNCFIAMTNVTNGVYTCQITAVDDIGNESEKSLPVQINYSGYIQFRNPKKDQYYTDLLLIENVFGGKRNKDYELTFSSFPEEYLIPKQWTVIKTLGRLPAAIFLWPWNTMPVPDGRYLIQGRIKDNSGNMHQMARIIFIDHTKPITKILINGSVPASTNSSICFYSRDAVSIGFIAHDPVTNLAAAGVKYTKYRINGSLFSGWNMWYSNTLPILIEKEGRFSVSYYSVDNALLAGNVEKQQSVEIVIDRTAPSIVVGGVKDGSTYKRDVKPTVSVTDQNLKNIQITLDGQSFVNGAKVDLEGKHVLRIIADDKAGNVAISVITFTIDKTPPAISFSGISAGQYYNTDRSVAILISDTDLTSYEVSLNGKRIALTNGIGITQNGAYVLAVTASDKAGNWSQSTISFTIDKTPPEIQATGVEEDGVYQIATPVVTILDDNIDTQRITLTLDGIPFVSGTSVTNFGNHSLRIVAYDLAGNCSEKQIGFTVQEKDLSQQLLFHASFNAHCDADFAVGDDYNYQKHCMRSRPEEGRVSSCLKADSGNARGALYEAIGNINLSSGTIACWIKTGHCHKDHGDRWVFSVGDKHNDASVFSLLISDKQELILLYPDKNGKLKERMLLERCPGATPWIPSNQWLHIAISYDFLSGKIMLYLNGLLIKEVLLENCKTPNAAIPYHIAVGYSGGNGAKGLFHGLIDEYKMFKEPLRIEQIKTLCE